MEGSEFDEREFFRAIEDDAWERRQHITVADGIEVAIPSFDDLILTKRIAPRPKDAEDIRTLEILRDKK